MGASWLSLPAPLQSAGSGATLLGAWLLTYALHSTVLLLTAWWLVTRRSLAWSPAARHAIWNVALVAGWITSAAQLASPWRPVGGAWQLPEGARRAMAAVQVTQRDDDRTGDALPSPAPMHLAVDTRLRLTVITLSRTAIAVLAWEAIALALLLRLAVSRHRLLASLGARRDATRTVAGDALRHIIARAGITRPVRLTMSDTLPAPVAISVDEIVVPSRALRELTIAEQEGVLAHELAHIVRGDPRWLRLATWIECIGWFQPLNRLARRELQLAAEFAADAWAVRLTREPMRLAQALARVAEWLSTRRAAPAWHMPGADGSPLVERVRRLTASQRDDRPLGLHRAHVAMWIAAASALALLPHIDTPPLVQGATNRLQSFEFRFADSSAATAMAPRVRTPLTPGVRVLRLGNVDARLLDGASVESRVLESHVLESRLLDRRADRSTTGDSGLVRSGARRMLIVTARAAS
jgi:beta-lactamase regulating signal transducer with metallopeptidase domain